MSAHDLPRAIAATLCPGAAKSVVTAEIVEAATSAALDAGALQRKHFRTLEDDDVRTKSSGRDLVTEVDVASERAILDRLRPLRPDWTVEAEEETWERAGDSPHWIVDPIDGTVNFVHGLPLFCVSIALYGPTRAGTSEPLFGLVHAPILGETFAAASGAGAFRWNMDEPAAAKPLRVSDTTRLDEAVLATGFPYRRGELEHSNLQNFNRFFYDVRGLRRMGSAALDLAFVAAGRLDGFWELHLSPYDVAAGALLVREAGGDITDAHGTDAWLRGGHIVAGPSRLTQAMRERIEV